MTTITFPDGSWLIDDSEIEEPYRAMVRASEGADAETIAREFCTTVEQARIWISYGPPRDPQEYWMEKWRDGTLHDPDLDDIDHTGD